MGLTHASLEDPSSVPSIHIGWSQPPLTPLAPIGTCTHICIIKQKSLKLPKRHKRRAGEVTQQAVAATADDTVDELEENRLLQDVLPTQLYTFI